MQLHFIVIASHVADLVKEDMRKTIECLDYFGLTIAMPSILITLYFGVVSIIPVKQFIVKSGECVIYPSADRSQ